MEAKKKQERKIMGQVLLLALSFFIGAASLGVIILSKRDLFNILAWIPFLISVFCWFELTTDGIDLRNKNKERARAMKRKNKESRELKKDESIGKVRTIRSRINEFVAFLRKASGNSKIYACYIAGYNYTRTLPFKKWYETMPGDGGVLDITLCKGNLEIEPDGKYTQTFEDAFDISDNDDQSPDLNIVVNKRKLTKKAEKIARLYKEKFGGDMRLIIND